MGTLVTMKDERLQPMQWKMGRIIEVRPGDDGIVRVATVKTDSGKYKRTIKLLCPILHDNLDL